MDKGRRRVLGVIGLLASAAAARTATAESADKTPSPAAPAELPGQMSEADALKRARELAEGFNVLPEKVEALAKASIASHLTDAQRALVSYVNARSAQYAQRVRDAYGPFETPRIEPPLIVREPMRFSADSIRRYFDEQSKVTRG